jgi:hypothetical protein
VPDACLDQRLERFGRKSRTFSCVAFFFFCLLFFFESYAAAYQDLDKSFIPILFFFPNMPHPFANKCLNARKQFEKVFLSVLEQRKQKPDEHYDDFLQVLIESK